MWRGLIINDKMTNVYEIVTGSCILVPVLQTIFHLAFLYNSNITCESLYIYKTNSYDKR